MKSTLNGIKFFGYFTLIAIVLLKCSFAKRENKLSGDPKFDVVADEVKETKQKTCVGLCPCKDTYPKKISKKCKKKFPCSRLKKKCAKSWAYALTDNKCRKRMSKDDLNKMVNTYCKKTCNNCDCKDTYPKSYQCKKTLPCSKLKKKCDRIWLDALKDRKCRNYMSEDDLNKKVNTYCKKTCNNCDAPRWGDGRMGGD